MISTYLKYCHCKSPIILHMQFFCFFGVLVQTAVVLTSKNEPTSPSMTDTILKITHIHCIKFKLAT